MSSNNENAAFYQRSFILLEVEVKVEYQAIPRHQRIAIGSFQLAGRWNTLALRSSLFMPHLGFELGVSWSGFMCYARGRPPATV